LHHDLFGHIATDKRVATGFSSTATTSWCTHATRLGWRELIAVVGVILQPLDEVRRRKLRTFVRDSSTAFIVDNSISKKHPQVIRLHHFAGSSSHEIGPQPLLDLLQLKFLPRLFGFCFFLACIFCILACCIQQLFQLALLFKFFLMASLFSFFQLPQPLFGFGVLVKDLILVAGKCLQALLQLISLIRLFLQLSDLFRGQVHVSLDGCSILYLQQRSIYAMAIERIQIGDLVIEKTIPDTEPEQVKPAAPVQVKAVSGDKPKEAVAGKAGVSSRLAKVPSSLKD